MAWTLIGRVPRRVGFDGHTPQSWADGTRRWDGFLPPEQVPVIRNPADGQLWTANNRVVGGDMLALLGDGGYDGPNRSGQIRDRLSALAGRAAKPADLLAIQLDDEALYLARWRELLLHTLTDAAVDGPARPGRNCARSCGRWDGHASVNAVGYRVLREFRRVVTTMVMNPILGARAKARPRGPAGAERGTAALEHPRRAAGVPAARFRRVVGRPPAARGAP